ncbi:uncharacterized protein LOC135394191 [Ornithodoros turicata]|uniref:uncharacterized protein LOC135394191 n=1 Tax=Ornithodoros turicata TaxID=34597 RepID=UPI003138C2C5
MTDTEEVETVLRSVLSTVQNGMQLPQLDMEYQDMVGHTIPFRRLGFGSLQAYIRSIPHVVQVKVNRNGQLTASAVSNASTAHITKMVSKQKRGPQKKYRYSPYEVSRKWQTSPRSVKRDEWKTPYRRYPSGPKLNQEVGDGDVDSVWHNFLREAGLMNSFVEKYSSLFYNLNLTPEDLRVCTAFDLEKLGVKEYLNVDLILDHAFRPNRVESTSGNFQVSGYKPHLPEKTVSWKVGRLQVTITNDMYYGHSAGTLQEDEMDY